MATDLLASIRSELEARLTELRPLLPEYERLLAAAAALDARATPAAARAVAPAAARAVAPAVAPAASAAAPDARVVPIAAPDARVAPVAAPKRLRGQLRERRRGLLRGPRSAAQKAILAALEHGSHTPSELVVVSALSSADIRTGLALLLDSGAIKKIDRDGKTAYELPAGSADA